MTCSWLVPAAVNSAIIFSNMEWSAACASAWRRLKTWTTGPLVIEFMMFPS